MQNKKDSTRATLTRVAQELVLQHEEMLLECVESIRELYATATDEVLIHVLTGDFYVGRNQILSELKKRKPIFSDIAACIPDVECVTKSNFLAKLYQNAKG